MPGELQFSFTTGSQTYCLIRNGNGLVWNTSALVPETYLTANYQQYVVAVAEQGTSFYFVGGFPPYAPSGFYSVVAKQRLGATPAESDPTIAAGNLQWNGSSVIAFAGILSSGSFSPMIPFKLNRRQMVKNFPLKFVSSTDHVTPFYSGVISGQITRDGGGFRALQSGGFTELGMGRYSLQALTSGDLDAKTVGVKFTAVGVSGGLADDLDFGFVLQGG
jgi:hypothetical protein